MKKNKLIEKLQNEINELQKLPNNSDFNEIILIKEKPKCPSCGEYQGNKFKCGGFIYHYEQCDVCGYSFTEE